MHSTCGCYYLKSIHLTSCKHVYQVFLRNTTFLLFCHELSAVEHKDAKTTTNSIFQKLAVFFLSHHFIQTYTLLRFWYEMWCPQQMIIIICDFSAVKGFKAEIWKCLCVHACIHVACLFTVHTSCQLCINLSAISECVMCTWKCYIMW